MLIKNVLKGIKHKPLRISGIILLIAFAGILYVSLSYVIKSADISMTDYANTYNQEDFSFEMNTYLSENERQAILQNTNDYPDDIQYIYQLTQTDQEKVLDQRIKYLEDTYDLNIEPRTYKQITYHSDSLNNDITIRVFKNNTEINKTYVEEGGRLPSNDHEIAIGKTFAKSNDLKLQDTIVIEGKQYTIVGFVYLVDYTYPQLSTESMFFDSKKQVLAVLNNEGFNLFNGPTVTYYSGVFNKEAHENLNQIENFYMKKLIGVKQNLRTGAIYGEIDADQKMIEALSGVILFLAVIIIGIVVNKSINQERSQIGVIKSLGYKNKEILMAYMAYPLIAGIIGSLLGYFIGFYLSKPIFDFFDLYYQMPLQDVPFDWVIFINAIILPIILLNLFSAVIIYFIVKKPPLDLIRIKTLKKMNLLSKWLSRLLKKFPFKTRFKYSIALRGVGKLVITFFGVLIASIYLVFALSGMQSFDIILGKQFGNADYKYQIIYDQPTNKLTTNDDDMFMMMPSSVEKNNKAIDVTLIGVKENLKHYEIKDENNKDLLESLYQNENNAVITSMFSMIHDINIGDTLKIKIINQNDEAIYHDIKVVGINENYTSSNIYLQLKTLNGYYGLDEKWHNGVWSLTKTTEHAQSIFDKDEMAKTMESMLGMAKMMIYTIIGISVILALIVLVLIASFNIEDNFKTISFLKVMGYKDKEVSQIVLNIYLPIILIGYLISVPLTLLSLQSLMKTISKELNFVIPFKMNIIQIVIGLILILFAYYLSLIISKRKLNKIALQEALKFNE